MSVKRFSKRTLGRLNSLFHTPPKEGQTGRLVAFVDSGCRYSRPEVEECAARAKEKGLAPVKIVDVYDKFQYDPEQYNLSRNEAMMNFYVIDQNGVRHKNMDAIFLLYWHSSRTVYYILFPFYFPLKFIFERVWLPKRFVLFGREDVRMDVTNSEQHQKWRAKMERSKSNG